MGSVLCLRAMIVVIVMVHCMHLDGQVNGQMDQWMDGSRGGRVGGSMDGRMGRWRDGQTGGWTDGRTGQWTNRQIDGHAVQWMDGQTDGWVQRNLPLIFLNCGLSLAPELSGGLPTQSIHALCTF